MRVESTTAESDAESAEWLNGEIERRIVEEDARRPVELDEIENLPAQGGWLANTNRNRRARRAGEPCRALTALIHGACNGWQRKPTALQVEAVMKGRKRGDREDGIAWTVVTESPIELIVEAEADDGYSLQDLGWWIRELKIPAYKRIRWLNTMGRSWARDRGRL